MVETEQIVTDADVMLGRFAAAHPNQENIDTFYNNCDPAAYEEMLVRVNFTEPYKITAAICDKASDDGFGLLNLDRASKVYDVGAGSGLVGELLAEKGFTHIEGGDASEGLINAAKAKYVHTEVRWYGMGVDKLPADKVGTFDCVTASGVWLHGHIPSAGIEDCHALLKTGGYFVTAMRSLYWVDGQEDGYKDKIEEFIAQGKLELKMTKTFMRGVEGAVDGMFE